MATTSYVFHGVALPDNLKESIDAFVETGRPTGSFLQACIDNNLREALGRADEISLAALPAIVGYLYNECPAHCWGKPDSSARWIEQKRIEREKGEQ